jgi:uncharacterized protein (UPF0335 family)
MTTDLTGKKPEFSLKTVLSNDVTKKQLLGFVEEIVLCEGKIKAEREAIKDIKGEAESALAIPSNVLSELVRERLDNGSIDAKIKKLEEAKDIAVGLGITAE